MSTDIWRNKRALAFVSLSPPHGDLGLLILIESLSILCSLKANWAFAGRAVGALPRCCSTSWRAANLHSSRQICFAPPSLAQQHLFLLAAQARASLLRCLALQ